MNLDAVLSPGIDLLLFEGEVMISSSEKAAVKNHFKIEEKEGVAQVEGQTWQRKATAQRDRRLGVKAYVLKDDGALENFISHQFLKKLLERGADIQIKEEGWMTVRIARQQEKPFGKEKRKRARIQIQLGTYFYAGWFTVFDIDTYDIVLGKQWMRETNLHYTIDHVANTMNI